MSRSSGEHFTAVENCKKEINRKYTRWSFLSPDEIFNFGEGNQEYALPGNCLNHKLIMEGLGVFNDSCDLSRNFKKLHLKSTLLIREVTQSER
jgi:hypothetical protein